MELFTVLVSSKLANLIWSCFDVLVSSTYNTRSAANQSYYIPIEQELIMASIMLGLMTQKYGIQLAKT